MTNKISISPLTSDAVPSVATGNRTPLVSGGHLAAVDGFRALACMMVVTHHCFVHAGRYGWPMVSLGGSIWNLSHLLSLGYIGVEFFFIVSGFCLYYPVCRRPQVSVDWGRYAKKRFARIYPPYFVAFVVLALVDQGLLIKHWVLGLFFISTVLNPSFWTLCLEARWYVVFPGVVYSLNRWGYLKVFIVSVLLSLVFKFTIAFEIVPLFVPSILWLKIGPLPVFLPVFLLGMGIASIYASGGAGTWVSRFLRSRLRLIALVSVVLVLLFTPKLPPLDFFTYLRVVPAGLAGASLLMLALYDPIVSRVFRAKSMQFLGVISYSVYLVHEPIIRIVYARTSSLGLSDMGQFFLFQGVVLPLCFFIGWIFYIIVERPLVNFARRYIASEG